MTSFHEIRAKRSKQANNAMEPRWSADEVRVLHHLAAKDFSASEIAERMGRTRNEVLGKLWRTRRSAA